MFEAKVFLAGPSRQDAQEQEQRWPYWQLRSSAPSSSVPQFVYIADAGIHSFLQWCDTLDAGELNEIRGIVWCGDGDSLGKHAVEIVKNTAARFEGRWREHFYSSDKDFSDCAAITSLIEYDLRHAPELADVAWLTVHGAIGGRADHELANLFEFSGLMSRIACPVGVLFGPKWMITTAAVELRAEMEQKFSLISAFANQQVRVRVSGARYSGELLLRQPSHGISNVVADTKVVIEPLTVGLPLIAMVI